MLRTPTSLKSRGSNFLYIVNGQDSFQVEIFTGDGGLKAYEPVSRPPTRRSSRKKE